MTACPAARAAAEQIAASLSVPALASEAQRRFAQSLAKGAAGTAMLHIERALHGYGTWQKVHCWLTAATEHDISAADEAALFIGAPSIGFILHAACADGSARYARSRAQLAGEITSTAHRRVDAALRRIDRHQSPQFAEYDLFYGLTGLGTLLLHQQPEADALGRILAYLVRLAIEPIHTADGTVPGWWVDHDPDVLVPTPGGHANFGLAHGISGPLALLSLAMRAGVTVERHADAIERICAWMDSWRQPGLSGPWWPQWITEAELRRGRPEAAGPYRPSWCYGTPGIARAQQLAALALSHTRRQAQAEHALAASISDPAQLAMIDGSGLCHGLSGVYQTAWRAAEDATAPEIGNQLPALASSLLDRAERAHDDRDGGLLDGTAGLALTLYTISHDAKPKSGWDTCLLIA
jgi:hypothetical protein